MRRSDLCEVYCISFQRPSNNRDKTLDPGPVEDGDEMANGDDEENGDDDDYETDSEEEMEQT